MTIGREKEAEIRRLYFAEHWKKGSIASQLCIHRDVVERVVGPLGPEPRSARRPRALDDYQSVIDDTLARYPTVVGTRIYDMVCQRGYTGSLETLRRVLRKLRPRTPREVFTRSETLPGEQSQIDWAHVGRLRVHGGLRPLYCFVMLLRHSRAIWAELVFEQTTASLVRSLIRAAQYFGGVTREWLFDNPRSIVVARDGRAIRFQDDLVELASMLHVALRACRVRRPTDKGGVERAIRYLKTRFFSARTISSIESGNAELQKFIGTIALERRHPTDRERSVRECLADERVRLLPLPECDLPIESITSVVADKTATIAFDTNRYSVPSIHAEKSLRLITTDTIVRLCDDHGEVASHPRCWAKGRRIDSPAHRADVLDKKPAARDNSAGARLRAEVPRTAELMQHWLDNGPAMGSLVRRTAKLLDLYGKRVLAAAVNELLDRGGHDYGALAMLCEKRRKAPRRVLPLELAAHVVERDVIPHDLGGYDDDDS